MDLYHVGIELSMTNGVSGVVGVIMRDLAGLHGKVGETEKGFSRLKVAIAGAAAVFVGGAMLDGMSKLVSKGAELTHQTQLMAAAGFTAREQAEAMARAWQLSGKYRSVGVTTVAEIIRETAAPYGSAKEAIKLADMATRATVALNAVMPNHQGGEAAVNQMFAAVKGGELRNISLDPSAMQRWFDDMVKVAEVTGGKVLPADFFSFVKYSRTNAPYLSERFLSGVAPALIQELGPSGAGTAITTLGQAIIGGKMTKRALAEFMKLGLVAPGNVIKTTGVGVQLKSGGVKGYALAETDPYLWAQKVLMPAMIAHGFVTREQQRLEFAALFSARNGETAANIMATQGPRIEKDRNMIAKGAVGDLFTGDLQTQGKAFHEQWENLLIAAGSPLVGPATDMIRGLTGVLTKMGQWASANPGAVRLIGEVTGALAAALVIGGTIAVGAAAIAALPMIGVAGAWAAGAAALAGGIGVLLGMNWSRAKAWSHQFHLWVEDVFDLKDPKRPPRVNPAAVIHAQNVRDSRALTDMLGAYWHAVTGGMAVHMREWMGFGARLTTALGAITASVSKFILDLATLPSRLVIDGVAHLFPPHPTKPKAPPRPPHAAAPKPPHKPLFHFVAPADVRNNLAKDNAFSPGPLLTAGLSLLEHIAGTDKAGRATGAAVGHGLAAGVASTHPAVRAATSGMADQAVGAARDRLQIHSPSRVFMGIGANMVDGLILGLQRKAGDLQRAVGDIAGGALHGGASTAGGLAGAVARRAAQAVAFFRARGWSPAQAAGIAANLVRESGLDAAARNARSGAYGVAQWMGARVHDFQTITGHALRGSALVDQLAFVDHELRASHAGVGRALMTARTAGAAAALVNDRFEINGLRGEAGRRGALAEQLAKLRPAPPEAMRFGMASEAARAHMTQPARASAVPEPGVHVHTTVHSHLHVDGRKMAEVVTHHQAKEASRPHAGVSTFDPTMSAAPVGMGYHP